MSDTFIHVDQIEGLLAAAKKPDKRRVREALDRAAAAEGLTPAEVAALLQHDDPELWEETFALAKKIKLQIYGRRIVLFAPLYVANYCGNDCVYCAFRASNHAVNRRALSREDLIAEVRQLEAAGHKRLLLVYGEHRKYGVAYMRETIETAYGVKIESPCGEIRRINVNAAPLSVADYGVLKDVGIGTYQVFQETYHPGRYAELHPAHTKKGDYAWRLYALHRAQEAGLDDVAVGALFGLYDWRFEILGILFHALEMERQFNVGPHTVSFPRLQPAINTPFAEQSPYLVSDDDFKKAIAVIRLMVPYTGMILTCREDPALRREAFALGVSQIDGGTRIGVGGYRESDRENIPERQQFTIHDTRSLDDVIFELAELGYLPSFCTACYRVHRTGEAFMNLAKHGHAKDTCQPNALLTFREYLLDYASAKTRRLGETLIEEELQAFPETDRQKMRDKLARIDAGARDIFM